MLRLLFTTFSMIGGSSFVPTKRYGTWRVADYSGTITIQRYVSMITFIDNISHNVILNSYFVFYTQISTWTEPALISRYGDVETPSPWIAMQPPSNTEEPDNSTVGFLL